MLNLPNVTLIGIDCHNPWETVIAHRYSKRRVNFAEVVLATDIQRHLGIEQCAKQSGIRIVDIKQSDTKKINGTVTLKPDYERDVLIVTPDLFTTEFCLHQEWDARVLNVNAWKQEFLEYDFIGAPWDYPIQEEGWSEVREENSVGNGGFAIKSHKLCSLIKSLALEYPDPDGTRSSDIWICRDSRQWTEGMRFAPRNLAAQFSCENAIYTGQFGYHGKNTALFNGWNLHAMRSLP